MNERQQSDGPEAQDRQLTETLRRIHGHLHIPDGEAAWEAMKLRLERKRRFEPWMSRMKLAAVAASLTFFISLFVCTINPAEAISSFVMKVRYASNGVTHVFYGVDLKTQGQALTAPPPDEDPPLGSSTIQPAPPLPSSSLPPAETHTLEEARQMADFIRMPSYLPEGFQIWSIMLDKDEETGVVSSVSIQFRGPDQQTMRLIETEVDPAVYSSSTSIAGRNVRVDKAEINGNQAVLIASDRTVQLQWVADNVSFRLHSRLSEEETLKVARSIK